jgi:hypothetical protein
MRHQGTSERSFILRRAAQALGLLSETRESWAIPPHNLPRVRWICAFTGAWGVLTGYAIFMLLSQQIETSESRNAAWGLLIVLAVAVTVVTIIEWLRELIHGGGKSHRRTLGSILISILLLSVFELCVLAYEEVSRTGFENATVLMDVTERLTSSQQRWYGFLKIVGPENANGILFYLLEAEKTGERNPRLRIVELLPEDLQRALDAADFHEPPEGLDRRGLSDFYRQATDPVWRAWLPWAKPLADAEFNAKPEIPLKNDSDGRVQWILVEGTEESLRSHSLVLVLNKVLADINFYREEYFQYPQFFLTDPALKRAENLLFQQQRLRAELAEVEAALNAKGGLDPGILWRHQSLTAKLLPLKDIVQRNRDLLAASFPQIATSKGQSVTGWKQLATLSLIWIFAGAVLGWSLGRSVFRASAPVLRSSIREAARGAMTAIFVAPSVVALYIMITRFGSRAETVLHDLQDWGLQGLTSLTTERTSPFLWRHPLLFRVYRGAAHVQAEALAFLFRFPRLTVWLGLLCIFALLFLWRGKSFWRPVAWVCVYFVWKSMDILDYVAVRNLVMPPFLIIKVATLVIIVCLVLLERKFGFESPVDLLGWGLIGLLAAPLILPSIGYAEVPLTLLPLIFTVALSIWRKRIDIRIPVLIAWTLNGVFFLFLEFRPEIWRVFELVGIVWLIPGALLGATVPYLKPGSSLPKFWGMLGLFVGAGLILLTWLRFQDLWWMSIPGSLLILTGVLIQLGWSVEEFWPLAALGLALLISGSTFLFQQASFQGVLEKIYATELGSESLHEELGLQFLNESPLRPDQIQLAHFGEDVEKLVAAESAKLKATQQAVTQRLELCLVGSLGFWMTIGFLASWSIFREQRLIVHSRGGPARCFWARGDLVEYHDRQCGVLPRSDSELFRRFSQEFLMDGRQRWQQSFFEETFRDFELLDVARMNHKELRPLAGKLEAGSKRIAFSQIGVTTMIIENAKRFLAFEGKVQGTEPSTAVLRDWEARAAEDCGSAYPGEILTAHLRSNFKIPLFLPLRTVLQSLGLIPGVHLRGCYLYKPGIDAANTDSGAMT